MHAGRGKSSLPAAQINLKTLSPPPATLPPGQPLVALVSSPPRRRSYGLLHVVVHPRQLDPQSSREQAHAHSSLHIHYSHTYTAEYTTRSLLPQRETSLQLLAELLDGLGRRMVGRFGPRSQPVPWLTNISCQLSPLDFPHSPPPALAARLRRRVGAPLDGRRYLDHRSTLPTTRLSQRGCSHDTPIQRTPRMRPEFLLCLSGPPAAAAGKTPRFRQLQAVAPRLSSIPRPFG